jgi:uncharacterized protein YukE
MVLAATKGNDMPGTGGRIQFLEADLRTLDQKVEETARLMEGALKDTRADMGTITATCDADSARIYIASMEDWCTSYQRVITAVNNLDTALDAATNRLVTGEYEAQGYARQ